MGVCALNLPIVSGLVLRLESDRGLSSNGTTVTSWKDTSTFGNDLVAAGDPSLAASTTPSGAPAIVLDGDGDKLERLGAPAGLPAGNQNRTVFFVVDYVDPQGVTAGAVYGDNAVEPDLRPRPPRPTASWRCRATVTANDFNSNADGVAGGYLVQSAVLSNGQLTHYRDGTQIQTVAHDYATDFERFVIGEEIGDLGLPSSMSAPCWSMTALSATPSASRSRAYLQDKYLVDDGLNDTPVAVGRGRLGRPGGTAIIDILDNDIDDGALERRLDHHRERAQLRHDHRDQSDDRCRHLCQYRLRPRYRQLHLHADRCRRRRLRSRPRWRSRSRSGRSRSTGSATSRC